jgi:hypothetical protein
MGQFAESSQINSLYKKLHGTKRKKKVTGDGTVC